jgi:hypothetical protein
MLSLPTECLPIILGRDDRRCWIACMERLKAISGPYEGTSTARIFHRWKSPCVKAGSPQITGKYNQLRLGKKSCHGSQLGVVDLALWYRDRRSRGGGKICGKTCSNFLTRAKCRNIIAKLEKGVV